MFNLIYKNFNSVVYIILISTVAYFATTQIYYKNKYQNLQTQLITEKARILENIHNKELAFSKEKEQLQHEIDKQTVIINAFDNERNQLFKQIDSYKLSNNATNRDKARIKAIGLVLKECTREYTELAAETDRLNNRLHIIKKWSELQ